MRRGTPEALEAAVALYQGPLLDGVQVAAPSFEEWLESERARLAELALEALRRLVDRHVKAGRADAAIQTAARLLALDPLQEEIHRTLMRLHARQGRRAAALRQYQTCVGVLQKELGVEPERVDPAALSRDPAARRRAGPGRPPSRAVRARARLAARGRRPAGRAGCRAGAAPPAAVGGLARRGTGRPRRGRGRGRKEPADRGARLRGDGARHPHAGGSRVRDRADPAVPALGGCAARRPRAGRHARAVGVVAAARGAGTPVPGAGRGRGAAADHARGAPPPVREPRRRAGERWPATSPCWSSSRTSTGPTR